MSYLALDIGTHAARSALIARDGQVRHMHKETIDLVRIDSQQVEQNPEQIIQAIWAVIGRTMAALQEAAEDKPEAMGIAIQRSTVLAWDRQTGEALSRALSWQDTRAEDFVEGLQSHAVDIQERSGLVLSAHYGASKMRHLLMRFTDTAIYHAERVAISPLISYVLWHLIEGHPYFCDESNAGRTQLWHIHERSWDPELCRLFDMELALLPDVKPVCDDYGYLRDYGIPVRAVAGDQNAALNAVLASPKDNSVLVNAGSGAFALTYVTEARRSVSPLLLGLGHSTETRMFPIVEGTVNGCGTALSWLAEQPAIKSRGGEPFLFQYLDVWAKALDEQDLPVFLNAVGNLGSPYWRTDLEPQWSRKNPSMEAAAVSVLESIVFLLVANIDRLSLQHANLENCVLTGGVAQSQAFCQKLASLSRMTLYRLKDLDSTLYGAARLASGFLMPAMSRDLSDVFRPQDEQYVKLHKRYQALVALVGARPSEENWIAHRGYAKAYPENTLLALEEALKCGAHAVEFDVQFSQDKKPVLLHDDRIDRTSDESGRAVDYPQDALMKISVHEPARFGLHHYPTYIPALESVVTLALSWPGRVFFLEIKQEVFEHLPREEAWSILEPIIMPIKDRVVLISFDADWIALVSSKRWRCGWVLTSYNELAREKLEALQVDFAICNIKKIQQADSGVWPGAWTWFVYDIQDEPTLNYCRKHKIRWLETWDIKGMMALK